MKILSYYEEHIKQRLSAAQVETLKILLWLITIHKQVRIERLAAYFPLPIKYERRSVMWIALNFISPAFYLLTMSETSRKKLGGGCLTILGALVVLAGGGAYLYFGGRLFTQELTPSQGAKIIPQEALATSFISTDDRDWSQLGKFGSPEAQKIVNNGVNKLQERVTTETGLNYDRDFKPWVGNVMLAFVPEQQPSQQNISDSSVHLLMIVGVKNKLKLWEFVNKLKSRPRQKTQEAQYQGITILETITQTHKQYTVAVLENSLIFSDSRKTVEASIDTVKGKPSYSEKLGVQEILSQSLSVKNPLAQVYIPDYGVVLQQIIKTASPDFPISPTILKQLEQIKGIVIGLGVEEQGVHVQAIAKIDPAAIPQPSQPISGKLLTQFPADTILLMTGGGIKRGWTQLVAQSQQNPDLQEAVTQIRDSLEQVNLNADTEVFGWMDGEFGLGVIGSKEGALRNIGMGGMLLWETNDRQTAQATLDKSNEIGNSSGFISVQQSNIQGKDITEWKTLTQEVVLSYAWLNNNSLVMTLGTPLTTVLNTQPTTSISENPKFKTITTGLPQKNLGYFYLDIEQMMSKINNFPQNGRNFISPENGEVLNSLQGLGMTTTMPDSSTSKVDLLLSFKSIDN